MNDVLEELTWRGLIAHSTQIEALGEAMDAGPITFYVGFDPTAPSIHMGNLVQLMLARALQRAGHRPLLLVGGSTGLIGDPKESGERGMNSRDLVAGWVERIRSQVSKFVSFEGDSAARLVNNLDWTDNLSTVDFLRDVGKHFPVNRMLSREIIRRRLDEGGISYAEFSYVLLQALDYLNLHRTYGCVLQTGGSDQWGNITAGVELIRRSDGDVVHALATPLLTKADGTKFGKTEAGTVWLDPELTSPYAFHQFFLNAEDDKVADYLKVFSERPPAELQEIITQSAAEPWKRLAQRTLADDVTDLVHSREERIRATEAAAAVFGHGDVGHLDAATLAAIARDIGGGRTATLPVSLVDALTQTGLVDSKSAARRAVTEGGAYVNNEKVTDLDAQLDADDVIAGTGIVLRRGRKKVAILTVASTD